MVEVHLPPVTVKQFLVENGSVGTKEGYRIKVDWVNRILKSRNMFSWQHSGTAMIALTRFLVNPT